MSGRDEVSDSDLLVDLPLLVGILTDLGMFLSLECLDSQR